MSAEYSSINDQIKASYNAASETESMARQLEARIAQIPGAKRHIPRRAYGQPVNTAEIKNNLTLSSLIMQDSAELSHFLGLDPSINRRLEEEKEAAKLRAEALTMQTEALRARNEAARQQREQRQNLSPWQRGYRSF